LPYDRRCCPVDFQRWCLVFELFLAWKERGWMQRWALYAYLLWYQHNWGLELSLDDVAPVAAVAWRLIVAPTALSPGRANQVA